LNSDSRLSTYHLLPSVRGDLLEKLGRFEEARTEFTRAAALAQNARERALLLGRAASCGVTATSVTIKPAAAVIHGSAAGIAAVTARYLPYQG